MLASSRLDQDTQDTESWQKSGDPSLTGRSSLADTRYLDCYLVELKELNAAVGVVYLLGMHGDYVIVTFN